MYSITALNAYIRKEKRPNISYLSLHFRKLEGEHIVSPQPAEGKNKN